jgi:hypothetical protein
MNQNKMLLEALANGNMRFERVESEQRAIPEIENRGWGAEADMALQRIRNVSWAFEEDKQNGLVSLRFMD